VAKPLSDDEKQELEERREHARRGYPHRKRLETKFDLLIATLRLARAQPKLTELPVAAIVKVVNDLDQEDKETFKYAAQQIIRIGDKFKKVLDELRQQPLG